MQSGIGLWPAIDDHGDRQPLIKLLQSGEAVPQSIAFHIGDLLDRHQLKLPKARPRLTPSYRRTAEQINLIAAEIEVHRLVHQDDGRVARRNLTPGRSQIRA